MATFPVAVAVTVTIPAPVAIPVPATREAIVPEAPKAPAAAKKAPPAKAKAKEHPATARALLTAGPSLQMGFSSKPVGDLATNRFTGPAVKPLPVVR